ncbi:MAG TPA: ABC transporter permease [Candidatus Acidoferrum sp.]|nr:ABC transporter permease [Candidatus Acidoferrum sp.]
MTTPATPDPATVLDVAAWEIRRILASRLNLVLLVALGAFFGAIVMFKHEWAVPIDDARHIDMNLAGGTAFGQLDETVAILLVFFGLVVPFLTADAVARDQKQRVHEILMTTPLSSATYVWGRFLAAMAATLTAAIVMVLAATAANVLIHISTGSYPEPAIGSMVISWIVLVLPAAVLLGGLSFACATLFPRLAMAVKLGAALIWVGLDLVVDIAHGLGGFAYWTPTSNGTLKVLLPQLADRFVSSAGGLDAVGQSRLAVTLQQQLPGLWPWVGPHLLLVLIGLVAVALTAMRFQRFRNVLN